MFRLISKFIFWIWGWKIVGRLPDEKKYITILAPHTSNWDLIIGIFARSILRVKSKFLAKASLFKPPFGCFFYALGGYPVDRSKSTNLVEKVIEIFNKHDEFILALAPEGTRKKVMRWKSGFYYIAYGADIPILMVSIDYQMKLITLSKPFWPSGNYKNDIVEIMDFYKDKKEKAIT